ncbi:MAG: hypothetical protein HUU21_10115 [Polyangiaceae bacterium]|nr:hypothetical protein [Polyangiaceae bacterium]
MSLARSGRWISLVVALAFGPAFPAAAFAQPTVMDKLKSEKLFREGKKLYDDGKYNEACEALAKSDELDPTIGTIGLLSACREKQGDLVAAWKGYLETKRRAEAKRDDRASFAAEQADALKARLSKLTITSRGGELDLEVVRDGETLPASLLGAPVPVNPGDHAILARIPGAGEWKAQVTLKEGEARTVEIPPLRASSGGSSGPPRWLAYVVGGVGLLGIGAGAAAGVVAMSSNEDSMVKSICPPTARLCPERDTAFTAATVSTVAFIAGGVGVGAGVVLFFVSSDGSSGSASRALGPVRIAPLVGRSGAGALVTGTF